MSETGKLFEFRHDGVDYLKLCIDITTYWRGSAFDRVDGIVHFYKRALSIIGSRLTYFETGTMSGAKPLKKDSLDMLPVWFAGSKPRADIYIMTLESGAHRNEPTDCAFYLQADEETAPPVGVARLMLPTAAAEDPRKIIDLTLDLVSKLRFESGHVGFGMNWDAAGDMEIVAKDRMFDVGMRYLGVDLADVDITLVAMNRAARPGIKVVNWLTLVGDALLDADDLRRKVNELDGTGQCLVHQSPGGVVIQAGPEPLLGDRNRRADLSVYERVGQVLAPYRFSNHKKVFAGPATPGRDAWAEWLARFDG